MYKITYPMVVHLFSRYKKACFLMVVMSLMAVLIGYRVLKQPSQSQMPEEKVVEVETVKRATLDQKINVIGTIKSDQQTILTTKANGILIIKAKAGQNVKKGVLIALVENKELEKNYAILKEAEEIAKMQYERHHALLATGVVSKALAGEKKAALLEAQKHVSDAKRSLEELKITAPFDGMVGVYKLRDGSQVSARDPLVYFYDPNSLLVELELPLFAAKLVNDGAPLLINNQPYHLTHVQKMLDEHTHMCPAFVKIHCPDCIIGTTVDVALIVARKTDVMVIPYAAVLLKEGKPYIYLVKENKAVLTSVELGMRSEKNVEVLSGIQVGDQVIAEGHYRLYPDAPVKVHHA